MPTYLDENGNGVTVVRTLPVAGQPQSVVQGDPSANELASANSTAAAAALTGFLAAVAGKRTYISGFMVDGLGATAASVIDVTITGVLGGTITRKLSIPAGVGVAIAPLVVTLARPIPASADNTAISVNVPTFGAGNVSATVSAYGFVR